MTKLTAERLRECLTYNPETGLFHWKEARRGLYVGDQAGCLAKHGYIFIRIDDRLYTGHRLAWLYVTGEWPKKNIDHINRVRSDNRFCNLREANQTENNQNMAVRSDNTSGHTGVYWCKTSLKWYSRIRVNGKKVSLGYFHSKEEAIAARDEAKLKHHPFGQANVS